MTAFNAAGGSPERIIIIGHGSPRREANTIASLAEALHVSLHPGCEDNCVRGAYLQFSDPDIETVIEESVSEGARRIILHPFFLNSGMHVTKDIPELISDATRKYPGVEFIYTEPLGMHEKLIEIVRERIFASRGYAPSEIERRSFEIIGEEADLSGFPPEQLPIIKRVIHATADFELGLSLKFHPEAVRGGIEAIRSGRDILTDVEMVKTGINKNLLSKWGGKVICGLDYAESHDESALHGMEKSTRSEKGIARAMKENQNVGVIAIGNAPTALLKLLDILHSEGRPHGAAPALIVGVPVGFVKAYESKVRLSSQDVPFITNLGRKGGSTVAVAIINALLKMADER
ncbi:MAG TPA: precorrin-8X methylmutase [Dissulfurispiraceae bacterium]|nr:precorrin-8X methylmutase [Dissulfurispiraceae bacterium]